MKLTLTLPVTPFKINQGFGVNYATYHQFGLQGHNGLDLQAYHGQPVYASHDGMVITEIDSKQGHGVVLVSEQKYDYLDGEAYYKTIYWHLADPVKEPQYQSPVKDNQHVKRGDLIGYADNTGFSTGDHLHFGLKPMTVGESILVTSNIEQANGYQGAIDPTPYFITQSTEDFHTQHPELSPEITPEVYAWHQSLFRKFYKLFTGRDYTSS